MRRYVARRLLQAVPTLLGISLLSFGLIHLAPGSPVKAFVEDEGELAAAEYERMRHQFGLDRSLPEQYGAWVWRLLHLDLGTSFITHEPVSGMIAQRLGNTLQLTVAALALSVVIGVTLGMLAALRRGSPFDYLVRIGSAVSDAVPDFWLGLVAILIFAVSLRLLPTGGMFSLGVEGFDFGDRVRHLIMPVLVLAVGGSAAYARYVRAETLEVLRQEYVRTAYAKGLQQRAVLSRHVLRNALMPVITFLGGSLARLFAGAVAIENVFSWPGMGRMGVQAVFQRDYPVLMGLLTVGSLLLVVGYLLADLAYGWADPRVKYD